MDQLNHPCKEARWSTEVMPGFIGSQHSHTVKPRVQQSNLQHPTRATQLQALQPTIHQVQFMAFPFDKKSSLMTAFNMP